MQFKKGFFLTAIRIRIRLLIEILRNKVNDGVSDTLMNYMRQKDILASYMTMREEDATINNPYSLLLLTVIVSLGSYSLLNCVSPSLLVEEERLQVYLPQAHAHKHLLVRRWVRFSF